MNADHEQWCPSPFVYTSWAFNKENGVPVDQDAVYNVSKAARRMGARTVCVQLSQGITRDEIEELGHEFSVVAWDVCGPETAYHVVNSGVDGFHAQIEGYGQYDSALETLKALGGMLPVAVVSDWGGLDSEAKCDALRAQGATTVYVEAYADSGPSHADLPHYVTELAEPRGYAPADAIPLVGTYRNEFPSSYAGIESYADNFGVYLIEPMTDAQLDAFAELAASPPTEVPPPTTNPGGTVPPHPKDTDCKASVRFAAQTWEAQQADYAPRARLVVARRVCEEANNDDVWTAPIPSAVPAGTPLRDAIVGLLDDGGVPK